MAALARTHSAFLREAEEVLYESLYIIDNDNSLKCMKTLATNPEKAALVRFLTITYTFINIDCDRRLTTILLKSLINMHSLSDFRMKSWAGIKPIMMDEGICKILCEDHLRLRTLYCLDVLDISQIIKSQTELQILGMYTGNRGIILKILQELHNAQIFLPIFFTLEKESFIHVTDHISIFPAFYSVDRCATIHQVLAQSLSKDQDNYMHTDVSADNIRHLSIYLIDSSDMPFISTLAKNMAMSFSQISYLNLWFERRCDISPQEIKEAFSFFTYLITVKTYVWPTV